MHRALLPVLTCAAVAASLSPAAASAVTIATGEQGRALMTWTADSGLRFAERTAGGTFTAPRTIAPPNVFAAFLSPGPGTAVSVLAYDNRATGLLSIRRRDTAASFDAPVSLLQSPGIYIRSAAANARGDGAALVRSDPGHLVLLTAVRGGELGQPQQIATTSDAATVAVGGDGRVVVAYYEFSGIKGVLARLGTVGSPLGPAQRLSSSAFSDVVAALDDRGNATVAFALVDERHRTRGTELVARRAGPGERFGPARVVARGGPPVIGAGFASFRVAAAGSTTALAFDPNGSDGRLGVAIARGGGRFGGVQRPTPPNIRSFAMQPFGPAVAVDRAGDVLLAYTLGIYGNPVHATERRAGSERFTSSRVLSTLGHGGVPSAALLTDRTRLIAWDDGRGDVRYTTRLAGRRPDLTPPRAAVTLLPGTEKRLRESNTARVRIGCSKACLVTGRATLRTTAGRLIVGAGRRVLRGGTSFVKTFTFDPAKRAGRAGDGSILRVTIDVESSSGASREMVQQIRLRRPPR